MAMLSSSGLLVWLSSSETTSLRTARWNSLDSEGWLYMCVSGSREEGSNDRRDELVRTVECSLQMSHR